MGKFTFSLNLLYHALGDDELTKFKLGESGALFRHNPQTNQLIIERCDPELKEKAERAWRELFSR